MGKEPVIPNSVPVMGIYTPAYRLSAGELIICSGIVPVDESGETVGENDASVQTRQVLTNLEKTLSAAGATLSDVVHLRVFSTDMGNRTQINAVRKAVFTDPMPASTQVQVVRLVDPRWLLEIEATAFVTD